jgi:hypothetical protein
MNMSKAEDEDVVNNNLPSTITQIARPEGFDTANYTAATHFHHINDPNLITLLFFSAGGGGGGGGGGGRHDGGSNTFLFVDTTAASGSDPFVGAQDQYIDSKDVSSFTWVSSFTYKENTMDGLKILHYALFSVTIWLDMVSSRNLLMNR